jgi:hypothetical protein
MTDYKKELKKIYYDALLKGDFNRAAIIEKEIYSIKNNSQWNY